MTAAGGKLIIVFTKNPVRGRVKTRLAASLGDDEALRIYESLRELTGRVTAGASASRAAFFSDFIPEEDLLLQGSAIVRLQEGRDLGERMHRAFLAGFEEGFSHIVLIGTDCPELSTFILDLAFECLDDHDAVVGPARDGGFYLIGLKNPFPELFLLRRWSTPEVLEETIRIIRERALSYHLLPALSDIDTIEDLQRSKPWQ